MLRVTRLCRLLIILCFQIGLGTSRGFFFPWSSANGNSKNATKTKVKSCLSRTEAQEQLHAFLQTDDTSAGGTFHIQGWRWHTMSLAREAERLHHLASHKQVDTSALARATHYVVGFNMKALHKIETELFFPWVQKRVLMKNPVVGSALNVVVEELEELRQSVQRLGSQLNQDASSISSRNTNHSHAIVDSIADRSAQVAQQTRSMLHLENTYLVPAIARLIPESDQKAFNNQVIRNLGIWDSRLHLVSMYEAIAKDPVELALFENTIPSIPRKMIPRWKRLLYEPVAGDLDL